MQLIIPVYQRNYNWSTANCDKLLSDLESLFSTKKDGHFFGSIVTTPAATDYDSRVVVDGQQRLTTVSLLILAAIKSVRDGVMKIDCQNRIEEAQRSSSRPPTSAPTEPLNSCPSRATVKPTTRSSTPIPTSSKIPP